MATSGSWNFSMTAGDVITAAYEDLGVIQPGQSPTTAMNTTARQRLNMLVKRLQGNVDTARGIKVWTRQTITLMLAKGQQSYLIGPATTDARASTLVGRTTISADEAASQTVLSITSNTDTTTYPGTTITMTASDFIGIELNDGTIHWSTISGTPTTTATIVDALPSAARQGNYVYWFTARAQRFPVMEAAVLRDENRNDQTLFMYRDVAAYQLGVVDKYADGDPTAILVEPLRLNTRITLDSQPTDVTKQILLTVLYPAEDYDSTSDDIAFPQECYGMLSWELALMLSPSFGSNWTPVMEANRVQAMEAYKNLNPEVSDAQFRQGESG